MKNTTIKQLIFLVLTINFAFSIECGISPKINYQQYETSEPILIWNGEEAINYCNTQSALLLYGADFFIQKDMIKTGIGLYYGQKDPFLNTNVDNSVFIDLKMKYSLFEYNIKYIQSLLNIFYIDIGATYKLPYIKIGNKYDYKSIFGITSNANFILAEHVSINFGYDYMFSGFNYKKVCAALDGDEYLNSILYSTLKYHKHKYSIGITYKF